MTTAPEAMPAFSPLKESSNTYVVSGVVPSTSMPSKKQSGAGLEAANISACHESGKAGDKLVGHFFLKPVERLGYFPLLLLLTFEEHFVDVRQGLPLDKSFQVVPPQVIRSNTMPKTAVLCLSVYHYAVKVEKHGYVFFLIH